MKSRKEKQMLFLRECIDTASQTKSIRKVLPYSVFEYCQGARIDLFYEYEVFTLVLRRKRGREVQKKEIHEMESLLARLGIVPFYSHAFGINWVWMWKGEGGEKENTGK